MIEYEVIDNFLPKDEFIKLQSLILGNEFSWYYNDYIINDGREESNYQFTHLFFWTESKSAHSIKLMPLLNKLGIKEGQLFKLKANLNVKTPNHEYGGYHTDGYKNKITSIFYINTNNGWTEFKDGTKVESVENRMLVFDSNLEHTGVSCTDQKRRVLFNFNYER